MKEVLRLLDAEQQGSNHAALHQYNLEVFAGEIMVVFGLAGSGLSGLLQLLGGKTALSGGRIYIDGAPAPLRRDNGPLWKKIYICGDIHNQFENLTVAENLDIFSWKHSLLQPYSRKKIQKQVSHYLGPRGVDIPPEAQVSTLTWAERLCMNLLQAKMAGASLVVIDSTRYVVGDEHRSGAVNMIRKMQQEGMAFLLLAYREEAYYQLANRFQRISCGTDVMEWDNRSAVCFRNIPQGDGQEPCPGIEGIWDECLNFAGINEFLAAVRRKNPAHWEEFLHFSIPAGDKCFDGNTVLVPRDSAWKLVENRSVADNVILPIPRRVARGAYGYIPPRMARNAVGEFYKATGISPEKQTVDALSFVERKILSIYRWVQARPAILVLHSPHFGLDHAERGILNKYLRDLAGKGLRILILSGSMQNLKNTCWRITMTQNSENAQIYV